MSMIERWKCVETGPHRARLAILGSNNNHIWGYVEIEHLDAPNVYEVGKEYIVATRLSESGVDG